MSEKQAIYEVTNTEMIDIGLSDKTTKEIEEVLNDQSCSGWLRWALRSALHRDPVDVANDAGILETLLESRADEMLKNSITPKQSPD
jgi:hypothetical protein